jgi:NADPH-dependent ferric siderophore reductase
LETLRCEGLTDYLVLPISGALGIPVRRARVHLLVDHFNMASDRMLDLVGQPGGPLADASLWHLEVVESGLISPTMQRMVLTGPDLSDLRYAPGQDLMLRVPRVDGNVTNRRYTIRLFDPTVPTVTIDASLHGAGPGTDWIREARIGDQIVAIGPRGKITPRLEADWHLFIGDETGQPGVLAMVEALPSASTVTALLEVDTPDDEQQPALTEVQRLHLRWVHRVGRSVPGDPAPLQEALAGDAQLVGLGHAYIAAEAGVVRSIQAILLKRGLRPDQISAKAYWRRGLPNAEHGEPTRPD